MSGYRPQNRGNRTAARSGAAVSRRLRSAGVNLSPSGNKHKRPGIFVTGRNEFISIYVDLDANEEDTREVTDHIADVVRSWGMDPTVTITMHGSEATGRITFQYGEIPARNDFGLPVRHVKTGEIVGYLTKDKFTPIEDVPK